MRTSVKDASKALQISQMTLRCGLRDGVFPFGYAVKTSSKYTYHISTKKLNEYLKGGI